MRFRSPSLRCLGRATGPQGKGSGSYPIPDAAHARNALARGAQHASPAELATIKRKVHERFPSIGGEHRFAHKRPRAG